jgi:hypothetical protein
MTNENYGVYSWLLNKPFKTKEELLKAEAEYNKAHEKELKEKEEKKQAAKKVEDAYNNYIKVTREANKQIQEAYDKFLDAGREFGNKYKTFHMSIQDFPESKSLFQSIEDLFNDLLF